jgi:ribosomal protein L14
MIKIGSILDVLDNTSIKKVKCIGVIGYSKKKYFSIGDIIVVVPFKSKNVVKGTKFYSIISATRYKLIRKNGENVKFPYNGVIMVKKKVENLDIKTDNIIPLGSRILFPVAKEIKKKYTNLSDIIKNVI